MITSGHFRLAVLAVGVCLVLPAYSQAADVVDANDALFVKTYAIKSWNSPSLQNRLVGVTFYIDKQGYMFPTSRYNVDRSLNAATVLNDVTKEVPIDQVPITGLFALCELWPELYPEAIPALLSNSNPKVVAAHVPADNFRALTDEERSLIPADDLVELDMLYNIAE